jgi:hypothetical protein
MLEAMSVPALMEMWERIIKFEKYTKEGDLVRCNCPGTLAVAYLSRRGKWHVPVLTGVVSAPLMRVDGSILMQPGYDPGTGLFLAGYAKWLPVPDHPTKKDAEDALDRLHEPFKQFPWVKSDEDPAGRTNRAVVTAAILTSIERRLLSACPLFGFSAPAPRTGKSLLAEAVAIIATGKPAPASSVSPNREEFRKALTSTLREGHAVINLDNIEHALQSADLCKIITQEEFSDRLLGENSVLVMPTNVLWTATGNNLMFRGDLCQRSLLCSLDARSEKPEEREFEIPNFKAHLLNERAKLVQAALTILKAFHAAGQPSQKLPAWGGFDEWSKTVREPLVWAGEKDPCETRQQIINDDPEKESALAALVQLANEFKEQEFTAAEAAGKANEFYKQYVNENLHKALVDVAAEKNSKDVDTGKLGRWFRSWKDRIVNGHKLERMNERGSHVTKWRVRVTK